MTKAPRRQERPEIKCQRILDYLNEHGERTTAQIAEALQYTRRVTQTYLQELRRHTEVRSNERQEGRIMVWTHQALATKTTVTRRPEVVKPAPPVPWRYVHLGTQRDHPVPNQRGQGAARHTVTVASSAEMI